MINKGITHRHDIHQKVSFIFNSQENLQAIQCYIIYLFI